MFDEMHFEEIVEEDEAKPENCQQIAGYGDHQSRLQEKIGCGNGRVWMGIWEFHFRKS